MAVGALWLGIIALEQAALLGIVGAAISRSEWESCRRCDLQRPMVAR